MFSWCCVFVERLRSLLEEDHSRYVRMFFTKKIQMFSSFVRREKLFRTIDYTKPNKFEAIKKNKTKSQRW